LSPVARGDSRVFFLFLLYPLRYPFFALRVLAIPRGKGKRSPFFFRCDRGRLSPSCFIAFSIVVRVLFLRAPRTCDASHGGSRSPFFSCGQGRDFLFCLSVLFPALSIFRAPRTCDTSLEGGFNLFESVEKKQNVKGVLSILNQLEIVLT